MGATSEHFSDAELRCHCGCGVNGCVPELVALLETFRGLASRVRGADTPVIVDDAYRCPAHNAAVGGVPHSQHELGRAADVRIEGMTGADLEAIARACPSVRGIGRSDFANYVHIDVRESAIAHWIYGVNGAELPYAPPAVASSIQIPPIS